MDSLVDSVLFFSSILSFAFSRAQILFFALPHIHAFIGVVRYHCAQKEDWYSLGIFLGFFFVGATDFFFLCMHRYMGWVGRERLIWCAVYGNI